jgi:hypothetical protein
MSKVRRIDWSSDEWLAGTFGVLSGPETAVYIVVLNIIYSRDGFCPNDARYLHTAFRAEVRPNRHHRWPRRVTEEALASLISRGKLHVTPDGQSLTNGRADRELGRARERMFGSVRAGMVSGKIRRNIGALRQPSANLSTPVSSNTKGLGRTPVRIITTKDMNTDLTNSTDAARDPAPDQTAPGRAPTGPDPFSHTKPPPAASPKTAERLASLAAIARAKLLKGEP